MSEQKIDAPQIPTVELGGKVWELKFGHKAMRQYCGRVKTTLSRFDRSLDDYDNQIKLLHIIMTQQEPGLRMEQLDEWLDEMLLEDVLDTVQQAVEAAMPKTRARLEKEQAEAEAKKAEEGQGENPPEETTSA